MDKSTDPALPPQFLATLLALAADGDTTDPPDWRSHGLLRTLEDELVQRQRAFEYYSVVCAEAGKLCTQPTAAALLQRGQFSGQRRVPDANVNSVLEFGSRVQDTILALPASPRRHWLAGMHMYDMGIIFRDTGNYVQAAHYQHEAAEAFQELGDVSSAAISQFLVAVEECNAAIMVDGDIAGALARLDAAYDPAILALQGHGWQANVRIHLLLGHAWADDLGYERFDEHAEYFLAYDANPRQAHWRRLVTAMRFARQHDWLSCSAVLDDVISCAAEDRNGDVTLTARLIKARYIAKGGFVRFADEQYAHFAAWTGLKGRVVMAIAARERARLPTS